MASLVIRPAIFMSKGAHLCHCCTRIKDTDIVQVDNGSRVHVCVNCWMSLLTNSGIAFIIPKGYHKPSRAPESPPEESPSAPESPTPFKWFI
jgi:hypothetical protein